MKRWLARRLHWVSGQLARVKTPQRHRRLISVDPWVSEPIPGVVWASWHFSYTVLSWAMHLDWEHWPHWGLVHDACLKGPNETCGVCGGVACDDGTDA